MFVSTLQRKLNLKKTKNPTNIRLDTLLDAYLSPQTTHQLKNPLDASEFYSCLWFPVHTLSPYQALNGRSHGWGLLANKFGDLKKHIKKTRNQRGESTSENKTIFFMILHEPPINSTV